MRKREWDGEGGKAKRWKRKRGRREGTSKGKRRLMKGKGESGVKGKGTGE